MKNKKLIIILLFIILCIIAGICIWFNINNNEKTEQQDDTQLIPYRTVDMITNIRLGIFDYDSMNPYMTKNREILYIDQLIFEPLFSITQDYRVTPCLAEEFSKIGDKEYIIKLRENVKWQNNKDFTAKDVKFSIEELQDLKNTSIYYENVKDIKSVEIIDNHTISIKLNKEILFFEYNLTFPIISFEQYNSISLHSSGVKPIGTGKYKIQKIDEDKIELVKNENWIDIDTQNANIKTIIINIYDSAGKYYNAFKLGSIDFIHTSNRKVEDYIGSMGYGKKEYANREFDYLALNCKEGILQFKEIRQAIKEVIDKEKIVSSTLKNKATISQYPLLNNCYLLNDNSQLNKPNIEKAKEILNNAGWKYDFGIWQKEIDGVTKTINIDLSVNKNNSDRVKVAEEIKLQLEKIGIKVNINKISESQYNSCLKNKQYEMILTGVYNSMAPNIEGFLGKKNLANYENEEINSNLNELYNITEENLIKEKYNRIFEIYEDEVPYIGLYSNHDMVAYSIGLVGDINPNCYSIFNNFFNWYRQ